MTQDKILEIVRKVIEDNLIDTLCKEGFTPDEEKCSDNVSTEMDYENGLNLIAKSYFDVQ